MVLGLIMIFIAIYGYSKLIKGSANNSKTDLDKYNKYQGLLSIIVSVFYFSFGLSLVLKLIEAKYAFNYIIVIFVLAKMGRYIIKRKYKKIKY